MYTMMKCINLSTVAFKAFPTEVGAALGICVSAMTQLRYLHMADIPLPVLKALAARTEPLELVTVGSPGVNWVSA